MIQFHRQLSAWKLKTAGNLARDSITMVSLRKSLLSSQFFCVESQFRSQFELLIRLYLVHVVRH